MKLSDFSQSVIDRNRQQIRENGFVHPVHYSCENDIQMSVIAWCNWAAIAYDLPMLQWLIHVPNGGMRPGKLVYSKKWGRAIRVSKEGKKLKDLGAKAGVWDMLFPFPQKVGVPGFWAECKHGRNGLSKAQREFKTSLQTAGWKFYIWRNSKNAEMDILEYIANMET